MPKKARKQPGKRGRANGSTENPQARRVVQDGYAIVVCSAGRPQDLSKTLPMLLEGDENDDIRSRICVQVDPGDPDIDEYKRVAAHHTVRLVDGVPGLPEQRRQSWLNHDYSHTLFVDDDIVRIVWPFGNLHHFASTLRQGMHDAGCSIGGIGASQRPRREPGPAPLFSQNLGLVSGYFYMEARESGVVLPLSDAQSGIGEDVERTVRHFARSGIIRIMNCAVTAKNALSKSGQGQAGGIAMRVDRDARSEQQLDLVHKLHKEYPDFIKPAPDKPNKCVFVWRAKRAAAAVVEDVDAQASATGPGGDMPQDDDRSAARPLCGHGPTGSTADAQAAAPAMPDVSENTAPPIMSDSGYSIRPCAVKTLHQHTKKPSEPLTALLTEPKEDAVLPQNSRWLVLAYGDAAGSTKTLHEQVQKTCGGLDLLASVADMEGRMYVFLCKSSQRTIKTFPLGYTQAFGIKLPGGGPRDRAATVSFVRAWFDTAYECTTSLEVTLDDTDAVVQEATERTSHMDKGQFARHIARLKMKPPNDRDALEQTTVRCRPELRVIRREEELLQQARHVVHFIGQNSTDRAFPEDFEHTDVLSDPWEDPDTGEVKQVSLLDFFEGDYHLRCTAVLLGPKSLNKTQLAEAMAAEFAKRYAEQQYYIKVSTMSALKKVQSYMREGVPVVFEEFATSDRQQQRAAFSADYLKNFANVEDGGQCRAPGSDVSFAPLQPRTVCYNGTKEEWLPLLGKTTEMHRGAMEKRLMFFNIRERMVREGLVQDHAAKRRELVERGKKRAGEFDERQGKRSRVA